jgi:HD-GYP domain-containing protein (c-di-GMP phosphodiesterase class II)
MNEEQIPLPSKIMTICDIYDALTASDRPYKPAMSNEKAIDILVSESQKGQLDGDLVQVFVDAKVFQVIGSGEYSSGSGLTSFSNHPCDYDLHSHD